MQRTRYAFSGFREFANPFKYHKRGVTFIQMPDCRIVAESSQRANAADPENDLLLKTCFPFTDIEP